MSDVARRPEETENPGQLAVSHSRCPPFTTLAVQDDEDLMSPIDFVDACVYVVVDVDCFGHFGQAGWA